MHRDAQRKGGPSLSEASARSIHRAGDPGPDSGNVRNAVPKRIGFQECVGRGAGVLGACSGAAAGGGERPQKLKTPHHSGVSHQVDPARQHQALDPYLKSYLREPHQDCQCKLALARLLRV